MWVATQDLPRTAAHPFYTRLNRRADARGVRRVALVRILHSDGHDGTRLKVHRVHMRRFTRLTNAFSKKVEMHAHAVAPHFMHYNFVRIHKTLKVTPAMAAGVTGKLWQIADIVALLPDEE